MLPVYLRSLESPGAAERVSGAKSSVYAGRLESRGAAERPSRTKSKVGYDQDHADAEYKTENYRSTPTRQSHIIFLS